MRHTHCDIMSVVYIRTVGPRSTLNDSVIWSVVVAPHIRHTSVNLYPGKTKIYDTRVNSFTVT